MKLTIELEESDLPLNSLESQVTVDQPVKIIMGDIVFHDMLLNSQSFNSSGNGVESVVWTYESQ